MRRGLLMVLANVGADDEAEFNRWYDREHMRERVALPGFLSAQRYVAIGDPPWKYLTFYDTESVAALTAPVYLTALANQSEWSKRVLASFRDPQRFVLERTCGEGCGSGGIVSLTRLRPRPGKATELRTALAVELLPSVLTIDGVAAARLLEADPILSRPVAEYPKGGLDLLRPDDWFVVVDGSAAEHVNSDWTGQVATDLVEALEPVGAFRLLWSLHRTDLKTAPGSA